MKKLKKLHLPDQMGKRLVMSLVGVLITACTVGTLRIAELGCDPHTCMVTGWANIFHTTYGTVYPFVVGALLVIDFLFDRSRLGIATLLNLFLTGFIADKVYEWLLPVALFTTLPGRIGLLLVTLIGLCFASSLYFTANLGVSGYDGISQIIAERRKWPFRLCRIGTDCLCVAFGLIFGVRFGADVGFGTILTAFCMGPLIQWFNDHVSIPLLRK